MSSTQQKNSTPSPPSSNFHTPIGSRSSTPGPGDFHTPKGSRSSTPAPEDFDLDRDDIDSTQDTSIQQSDTTKQNKYRKIDPSLKEQIQNGKRSLHQYRVIKATELIRRRDKQRRDRRERLRQELQAREREEFQAEFQNLLEEINLYMENTRECRTRVAREQRLREEGKQFAKAWVKSKYPDV